MISTVQYVEDIKHAVVLTVGQLHVPLKILGLLHCHENSMGLIIALFAATFLASILHCYRRIPVHAHCEWESSGWLKTSIFNI